MYNEQSQPTPVTPDQVKTGQQSKPRPVVTSRSAKEHLFKAKTLMDETYAGIVMQKNRLDQIKMQSQQQQIDQQKVQQKFQNDSAMQQQKINAVNPLH